ncbi:MAG TPA: hypothetical protein IAC04_06500 [Candidatus Coprenecus stercoravium]|uniref:Lipoprotein n=1 Tax=Candidatus Coprenecus stercoravium TaxID=2840735 RepID=A0A9D2KBB6_9BACT|nr:hypothetical protein [Candidatus Coprenecus stercoravium]
MRVYVIALVSVSVFLAVSCGGRGKVVRTESPFTQKELAPVRADVIRAEGTGTSADVNMATNIARMNAMTVLAGKLNGADTLKENLPDGGTLTTSTLESTPVVDVTLVDRRVFRNRSTNDFTVWVLLETRIDGHEK